MRRAPLLLGLGLLALWLHGAACTPRSAPVAAPRTGSLDSDGGDCWLGIEPAAVRVMATAVANRDERPYAALLDRGDVLIVPSGTPAMLVNRLDGLEQVEITAGPLAGRRGWLPLYCHLR